MRKKPDRQRTAFTLIEVLVATFILVVMVLILSKIFHQASVAWSAGFRRAEGNMTGRTAVGFMARELMNACADRNIFFEQYFDDHSVQFITLGDTNANGRVARQITYYLDGDGLIRREKWSNPNNYGEWQDPPSWYNNEWCLVTNVEGLVFEVPSGWTPAAAKNELLPPWVRITLTLNRKDDVSGVGARSAGPDEKFGNDDDVKSY